MLKIDVARTLSSQAEQDFIMQFETDNREMLEKINAKIEKAAKKCEWYTILYEGKDFLLKTFDDLLAYLKYKGFQAFSDKDWELDYLTITLNWNYPENDLVKCIEDIVYRCKNNT